MNNIRTSEGYFFRSVDSAAMNYIDIELRDADVRLFPNCFSASEADRYLNSLFTDIDWQHLQIRIYGRMQYQPRLTAWHGDPGISYTYSGLTLEAQPWTDDLLIIKHRIESVANCEFNSVLLNHYRDGSDSMGWHSDDERELGPNPVIGSVSFGETRFFHLQHKRLKNEKRKIPLTHGSYLLAKGETQHNWRHQVPKSSRPMDARINLTFRTIKSKS